MNEPAQADPGGPVLGLIVNPIAGMGGTVALHGTDGAALAEAVVRGAEPVADTRARRALDRIARHLPDLHVVAAPGVMGSGAAEQAGLHVTSLDMALGGVTTADDTRNAVSRLQGLDIDLLLFVGGDGTARDVTAVTGTDLPVLGVPAGVKMHSGVFGTTPESAADIAIAYLRRPTPLTEVEILDIVDDPSGDARLDARLFSVALVPYVPTKLQRSKASPSRQDEAAVDALCAEIAASLASDRYHLVGPGTTTSKIIRALGAEGSLTGVDVIRDGVLVVADATEHQLVELLSDGTPASLILGVIGGQGFLLGRGNQQFSPRVLSMIDSDDIMVVASEAKILALDPPVLHVDLDGDAASRILGYRRVRTGRRTTSMLRVVG